MLKNKPTDAITLGDLSKRFDDEAGIYDALKGIDLTVHKGEFVAIMGPSGSGKSTLMNIIGLLDRPTQGTYLLDGVDTNSLSNQDLAKLRRDKIGFVFQNFNLLPRLNIRQNVEMPLIYKRVAAKEREDKVIKALSSVGLLDKINNRPNRMSGGQIQRAAIARALINDPSIILADEPTGNLDTKTGKEIMNIIKSLNNKGATIILVTHNPEVSHFADRTIVVRDGLIKAGGAVE
ncbi:MAG: ABC transporter ATP-binding protein [Patescibacteria group bacterium]|nr:ABC transporter ATP-binding protein [Patescibacteria group bacterium]